MHVKKVKAISPLVAALLLIMVGIAGAVLVYLWLTGFAGKGTVVPPTMEIQLKIEAAKLDTAQNQATIYVRNVGATTIDCEAVPNVAVYVYDSYTGKLVAVDTDAELACGGDNILEPGELGQVTASIGGLKKGDYYDIKLVVSGVEYIYPGVRAE